MTTAAGPERDLGRASDAQYRFLDVIGGFNDSDLRRPSLLPGWTVAHVLVHLARNADSHRRRAEAAARGDVIDQYPGGFEGRAAQIEGGAARTRAEILDDVGSSADGMQTAWRRVPDSAWDVISRDVSGKERPLRSLPARRWQELEVHIVDVDAGVTHRGWSADFVDVWLPALRATAEPRLPRGAALPAPGTLDDRDELAWLYGRFQRSDLPELTPWR
ncbi:MAG TPA: maleylpyruvate isomerase N-terminal domain-containing protein [Acidimicrobiia bacterium]